MIAAVYTDGGQILSSPSPYGGTWAVVRVGDDDDALDEMSGLLLPHHLGVSRITNNDAETYAMVRALESLDDDADVVAYSDSEVTLKRLARVYRGQPPTKTMNQELYDRAEAALSRLGVVRFAHCKGHPLRRDLKKEPDRWGRLFNDRGQLISRHQVRADELCTEEAQRFLDGLKEAR